MSAGRTIESAAFERLSLPLDTGFTISRGTTETVENVLVRLEDGRGTVGTGAAAPSAYYGEDADSVEAVLPELLAAAESVGDPANAQRIEAEIADIAPDSPAARAAVSIAVHDLAARQAGEPLYSRLGLDPVGAPATSFTIGIDPPAEMASKAQRAVAAGHTVLKVKLGTDDDRARIDAVRRVAPGARIRVDANADWTAEEAIEKSDWLANAGVEFVEQPVPADDIDGLARVAREGFLPVAADETCVTAADVPAVADATDIVVVKLMKCGGIRPAIRQIETARAHGLDVMLGCMVETNAAIAASWHLSPLADYADLDGSLLLADDPYDGPPITDGRVDLTATDRGTGAEPAADDGTS